MAAVLVAVSASGCAASAPSVWAAAAPGELTSEERVAIYAAVLTYDEPPRMAVPRALVDATGTLTPGERAALVAAVDPTLTWRTEQSLPSPTGMFHDASEAYAWLWPLQVEGGRVVTARSLWCGGAGGERRSFVLEKRDGRWAVQETQQVSVS